MQENGLPRHMDDNLQIDEQSQAHPLFWVQENLMKPEETQTLLQAIAICM